MKYLTAFPMFLKGFVVVVVVVVDALVGVVISVLIGRVHLTVWWNTW